MPTEVIAARLGALAGDLASLFTSPSHRTYWAYLVVALVVAAVLMAPGLRRGSGSWSRALALGIRRWTSASSRVDVGLIVMRPVLFGLVALPWTVTAWTVARTVAGGLDDLFGIPDALTSPALALAATAAYTITLFVAWDFSRFVVHWAMHRIPALWQLHQVHHSATVLTPLTLYRVHPFESLIYALRGIVVTGFVTGLFFHLFRGAVTQWEFLGVNAIGVACSAIGGNLRHSHVRWSWGPLERWLISPAQHQLHHARDATTSVNLGTWLSVWDRLAGTLRRSARGGPQVSEDAFGLAGPANHRSDSVSSALVGPLWGLAEVTFERRRRRRSSGR